MVFVSQIETKEINEAIIKEHCSLIMQEMLNHFFLQVTCIFVHCEYFKSFLLQEKTHNINTSIASSCLMQKV